jgi:hypothetical protein
MQHIMLVKLFIVITAHIAWQGNMQNYSCTVSDKINTTYTFDFSVFLVVLAVLSRCDTLKIGHTLDDKGFSFLNWHDWEQLLLFTSLKFSLKLIIFNYFH